jgi:peptidase E
MRTVNLGGRIDPGARPPQIVAFGGGGFSMEPTNPLLDQYVLGLTGSSRPRVCFLPTASGDADHYIVRFYRTFAEHGCDTSHVSLFRRDHGAADIHEHLMTRDVVYVGGGSVISLLGTWRAHGLDVTLRRAWASGVILCGLSAGSLCWFQEGVTGFHGEPVPVQGLGFLPGSNCVHFDQERSREKAYRRLLIAGMAPGYAADDGTGLHFVGERLARVVSSRPGAMAHRLHCTGGRVKRQPLAAEFLGEPAPVALAG